MTSTFESLACFVCFSVMVRSLRSGSGSFRAVKKSLKTLPITLSRHPNLTWQCATLFADVNRLAGRVRRGATRPLAPEAEWQVT